MYMKGTDADVGAAWGHRLPLKVLSSLANSRPGRLHGVRGADMEDEGYYVMSAHGGRQGDGAPGCSAASRLMEVRGCAGTFPSMRLISPQITEGLLHTAVQALNEHQSPVSSQPDWALTRNHRIETKLCKDKNPPTSLSNFESMSGSFFKFVAIDGDVESSPLLHRRR